MTEKTEHDISDTYAELNRREPLSPPPALDAAILADAHRAAQSKPRPVRAPIYRWAPPVAMAATVVLTATLVILIPKNEQRPEAAVQREQPSVVKTAESKVKKEIRQQSAATVAQQGIAVDPTAKLAMEPVSPSPTPVLEEVAIARLQKKTSTSEIATSDLEVFSDSLATESAPTEMVEEESIAAETFTVEAGDQAQALAQTAKRTPNASEWRKRIEALIKEEKWEEADKAFAKFSDAYPDHEFVKIYKQKRKEINSQ